MKVKICGITRAQDALLASDLGASAIGFVFWPKSPRYVDPVEATAIGNVLVQARAQGFVSGDLEALRAIAMRAFPPKRFDPRAS